MQITSSSPTKMRFSIQRKFRQSSTHIRLEDGEHQTLLSFRFVNYFISNQKLVSTKMSFWKCVTIRHAETLRCCEKVMIWLCGQKCCFNIHQKRQSFKRSEAMSSHALHQFLSRTFTYSLIFLYHLLFTVWVVLHGTAGRAHAAQRPARLIIGILLNVALNFSNWFEIQNDL